MESVERNFSVHQFANHFCVPLVLDEILKSEVIGLEFAILGDDAGIHATATQVVDSKPAGQAIDVGLGKEQGVEVSFPCSDFLVADADLVGIAALVVA